MAKRYAGLHTDVVNVFKFEAKISITGQLLLLTTIVRRRNLSSSAWFGKWDGADSKRERERGEISVL